MQVPHNTHVLVADGAKMLFFRNEGDAQALDLKVVDAAQQRDPATRDIMADQAGRKQGGQLTRETDPHQQAEDDFAANAAAMLNKGALSGAFEKLIVIASPKTLGEMRHHYRKELSARILAEVPKDLANHSVDRIEAALTSYDAD